MQIQLPAYVFQDGRWGFYQCARYTQSACFPRFPTSKIDYSMLAFKESRKHFEYRTHSRIAQQNNEFKLNVEVETLFIILKGDWLREVEVDLISVVFLRWFTKWFMFQQPYCTDKSSLFLFFVETIINHMSQNSNNQSLIKSFSLY